MSQNGFSFVELLCALMIGLISVSILVTSYFHFRRSNTVESALFDIQENSRFASHILRATIRQAGLMGSARLTNKFSVTNNGVPRYNVISYDNHIDIFKREKYLGFHITPKGDSDVILIRYMSPVTNSIIKLNGNRLVVYARPKFQPGDNIIISDISHAVLAHIVSISFRREFQYLSLSKKINLLFNKNAEVGKLKVAIFFVGMTHRKNKSGDEIYALYMIGEGERKLELISDVVDLKVKCFEKIGNRLIVKLPSEIKWWFKVVALQIDILFRSNNPVLEFPKPYLFQFHILYPRDRYLYHASRIIIPLKEHLS